MSLRRRHLMIWMFAFLWIAGTCRFVLGARSVQELTSASFWERAQARFSDADIGMWFMMLMAVLFVGDRLVCRYADWRYGTDPLKLHWSKLRNRDGAFLCGACLSPFLLPPEGLADDGFVACGDCGHEIAPYSEMKPHFPALAAAFNASVLGRRR